MQESGSSRQMLNKYSIARSWFRTIRTYIMTMKKAQGKGFRDRYRCALLYKTDSNEGGIGAAT